MITRSLNKRSHLKMRQTDILQHYPIRLSKSSKNFTTKNTKTMFNSSNNDNIIIGRDDEYKKIYNIINDDGLLKKSSLTIYVSGPPGTGKTFTMTKIIENLSKNNDNDFKFISINCMSFQNVNDFYLSILKNFIINSNKKQTKKQILNKQPNTPNKNGTTSNSSNNKYLEEIKNELKKQKSMTIILLDEIDQLQTKNQLILNNIFRLPLQLSNSVILIGIANSLDFTTKSMSWLKNGNDKFYEIRFLPYRKEQIVQIIKNYLNILQNDENKSSSSSSQLIDCSAIEFCARKIASSSGDIRKALDVCRRCIEIIQNNNNNNDSEIQKISTNKTMNPLSSCENIMIKPKTCQQSSSTVNIKIMMDVLNKVYGNAIDKIDTTNSKCFLPSDQQIILSVFLVFIKIRSIREIRLTELREMLLKICRQRRINSDGKTESDILNMCQYLSDYGYVKVNKNKRIDISGSPFSKRTSTKLSSTNNNNNNNNRNNENSITLSLIIDPSEAEQLISTFHRSIVDDAFIFV